MDLRLHLSVLWRFRYLVLGGLVLAILLSFFSYFRIDLGHMKLGYRSKETWESTETILLTQRVSPIFSTNPSRGGPNADPNWLLSLPSLYSELANSNLISQPMQPELDSLQGSYSASQDFTSSSSGGGALPFLTFYALAPSQAGAVKIARDVSNSFLSYVAQNQASQRIPSSQRVLLQVVTPATYSQAQVAVGRKKTVPIIIFLAVMIATIGLAYILENLRPRWRTGSVHSATPDTTTDVQSYSMRAASTGARTEISRSRI
jgi:hypothetical protein